MGAVRAGVAGVALCLGTCCCTAGGDSASSSPAPAAAPSRSDVGARSAGAASAPDARGRCFGVRGSLVRTDGDDHLVGTPGEDFIVAGAGDDVIERVTELDHVCAGPGDDVVRDVNSGGVGLSLGRGDDVAVVRNVGFVEGKEGDDRCVVTGRWAYFHGGPGDDVMKVTGPGGGPFDEQPTASYTSAAHPVRVDLAKGRVTGQGSDTLVGVVSVGGTRYGDVFLGSARGEYFGTRGGDDVVRSGGGNDHVYADGGADVVRLGPGGDTAWSGDGDDRVAGGPGRDSLMGEGDDDSVTGGRGDDRLSGDLGDDLLAGGPGFDAVAEGRYRDGESDFGDDRLHSIERWTTRILPG
jgi:Ca2+-binding RTX toxin-like protein